MKNNVFSNHIIQEEKYYSLIGDHDFIDNDGYPRITDKNNQKIVAKAIKNKKERSVISENVFYSYFIKTNPKLEVYNPVKTLSTVKDKPQNNYIEKVCKNEWTFKEVDKNIFNKYISFLLSKETRLLKDIERDLK